MKTFLPIIALAFMAASCSTAYKSGQTPDDVYFSPGRPQQEEYVRVEKKDNRQYRSDNSGRYDQNDQYNTYEDDDDRYLRMKVRNRQRWSALDYDDWYSYSPYAYGRFPGAYTGVNLHFGSPWSSYGYWDPFWHRNQYFYNPYGFYSPYRSPYSYHGHAYGGYYGSPYGNYGYGGSPYYGGGNVIINNPRRPAYSRPRTSNMEVYNTPRTSGRNADTYTQPGSSTTRPSSPRRSSGPDLRAIFNDDGNRSSSPSYSPGGRSSSNNSSSGSSGSSSSGSSGSSGGNAPIRRF